MKSVRDCKAHNTLPSARWALHLEGFVVEQCVDVLCASWVCVLYTCDG